MARDDERRTIGESFPATQPLSQWMIVICMAANDLMVADARVHQAIDENAEELGYYLRLVSSHFHELAEFLKQSQRNEAVRAFLDSLSSEAREREAFIRKRATELSRPRQGLFHYPKVGDDELAKALAAVADETAAMTVRPAAPSMRFEFADVVALRRAFGDPKAEAFKALVDRLHDAVSAFAKFASEAFTRYREDRGLDVI
jgi:hypothetical protein